jgi:hypothetical protein
VQKYSTLDDFTPTDRMWSFQAANWLNLHQQTSDAHDKFIKWLMESSDAHTMTHALVAHLLHSGIDGAVGARKSGRRMAHTHTREHDGGRCHP